jgi:hypothetical protein
MRLAISLAVTAALVFSAQPLPRAAAQGKPAYKDWPSVGHWQVFLKTALDGQRVCTDLRDAIKRDSYSYTLELSISAQESHLTLLHIGPGAPKPAEISLEADGRPVASFVATNGAAYGPDNVLHPINAVMPGDSYSRLVLPALSQARELTVIAGNRRYPFELADLRRTTTDLAECARLAAQP